MQARRKARRMKEEELAATKIQAGYKGMHARGQCYKTFYEVVSYEFS
jgi:hypothetical protein